MNWSPDSARNAYPASTIKLTNKQKEKMTSSSSEAHEPEGKELISAFPAAGMSATPMVEVTSEVLPSSTVALAAAVRQTGGKVMCIIPELNVNESKQVIEDSGLDDRVEFKTGPDYGKIDLSAVD